MLKRVSFVVLVGAMAVAFTTTPGAQQLQQGSEQELLRRVSAQPADLIAQLDLIKLYAVTNRLVEAEQLLVRVTSQIRQQRLIAASQPTPQRYVTPGTEPMRVGGSIKEPRKIRHVAPIYPEVAQSARVQGMVILEVVIATDGTVDDAKVLRSQPLLDQAAIDAVRQWAFEPTMLNGVPVPLIMTVTVNFTLN